MLRARDLHYRAGGLDLLHGVSLDVAAGSVHAVLGPNVAGKSTLLRLLSGERTPHAGGVSLNGRGLADWPLPQLARQRAVLPQHHELAFAFSVEEVVRLGRLPATQHGPAHERAIIDAALEITATAYLRERRYTALSGGERARVQLARVLAQIWEPVAPGPRLLLLDEPTASLDLAHQHHCLRIARAFAARDVAVLAVLHDPNLVLDYADSVTLLCCGEVVAQGAPAHALSAERLARVYGVPVEIFDAGGRPWVRVAVGRIEASRNGLLPGSVTHPAS
jgi:iron complex transport system ATP-binding protein